MRNAISQRLERLVARGMRPELATQAQQISSVAASQQQLATTTVEQLVAIRERLDRIEATLGTTRAIAASALDEIPVLRRLLLEVRASRAYELVWSERDPLVSVCIPTHARPELLVERALPSVMRQTHQNFEVIVVGDGCTDDTASRVESFGDPRVRFVNMPFRFPYPEDAEQRWLVAGAPGMNLGAQLARGSWIAMLGDDDEFTPDHIECLLDHALGSRFEMVYGQILQHRAAPHDDIIHGTYPPRHEQFGVQAAMYIAPIRFFDFNVTSWLVDEPGDWNLCRRMIEAGVRIGYVERIVAHYYPSKLREDP